MDRVSSDAAQFAGFFNDAAIFPPGLADLSDAVHSHLERRLTALTDLVGPLLLTTDKLLDAAHLAHRASDGLGIDLNAQPVRIGLVVTPDELDTARGLVDGAPTGVEITGLEMKTDERWRDQLAAAVAVAPTGPYRVHVELSASAVRDGGIASLEGTHARLKFRTGGLEAGMFPTDDELAGVIHTAAAHGVPFKLTAGLHQAIRHSGAGTGFQHHGFLNIAFAAATAQQGGHLHDVAEALSIENPKELVTGYRGVGIDWRTSFESIGTCSILEPVESLVALDLLPRSMLPVAEGDHE